MIPLGILASQTVPIAPISCAYPLNATEGEIIAAGFNGRLDLSDNDQTGSLTLVGSRGTNFNAAATSGSVQTLDFTSGKTVVEWATSVPTSLVTDPSEMGIICELFTIDLAHTVSISVGTRTVMGVDTYVVAVATNGVRQYIDLAVVAPITTVALLIDADVNTLTAYVNNVPLVLTSNAVTPAQYLSLLSCQEDAGLDPADAGKVYSATLHSAAADMTTTFPAGTKDGCGTIIGA